MVFKQMFAKGIGTSLMESDDELGLSKSFLGGGNRFEIAEQDILTEKEKQLRYNDIAAGQYHLSISSLSGKFKLKIRVHNRTEDFVSIETKLSGRGKHSKYECEFQIGEGDAPVVLDLFFKDNLSLFWRRSSYDFRLTRVGQPEPATPSTPLPSDASARTPLTPSTMGYSSPTTSSDSSSLLSPGTGSRSSDAATSQQRIKVKICVGDDIRFLSMFSSTTFEKLRSKLVADYGEGNTIKYEDIEGQFVTIENQEDLDNFFEFCKMDGIPKLYLLSSSSSDAVGTNTKPNNGPLSKSLDQHPISSPLSHSRRRSNTSSGGRPAGMGHHRTKSSGSEPTAPIRKWQKGSLLGAGNFGRVYLGLNNDSGTMMAVKEITISSNGASANASQLKALEDEISMMSQLNHDHIVRYLGMERTVEKLYIFLDFIPGGSLEAVLNDFSLPENVVRLYTLQMLEGLAYLHRNKIIHRDIKAANVLLDDVGSIYLADFGSSKKLTTELSSQENRSLSGTPNYMSPEVIKTGSYTEKADIWSLGCTILEMLTRRAPWYSELSRFDNVYAFFSWLTEGERWAELEQGIPEHLSQVCKDFIRKCLTISVDERPTAEELLEHPFIVEAPEAVPNSGSETSAATDVTPEVRLVDSDEDEEDFDGLLSTYGSSSDEDDEEDTITRDILLQHAVIKEDEQSGEESPSSVVETSSVVLEHKPPAVKAAAPAPPSAAQSQSLLSVDEPSQKSKRHSAYNLLRKEKAAGNAASVGPRRQSLVLPTSSKRIFGSMHLDRTSVPHRKLAMRLLHDTRSKRASLRMPRNLDNSPPHDESTAQIQKFLQHNALSQTSRMLSNLEKQHERFKKFVVHHKK